MKTFTNAYGQRLKAGDVVACETIAYQIPFYMVYNEAVVVDVLGELHVVFGDVTHKLSSFLDGAFYRVANIRTASVAKLKIPTFCPKCGAKI